MQVNEGGETRGQTCRSCGGIVPEAMTWCPRCLTRVDVPTPTRGPAVRGGPGSRPPPRLDPGPERLAPEVSTRTGATPTSFGFAGRLALSALVVLAALAVMWIFLWPLRASGGVRAWVAYGSVGLGPALAIVAVGLHAIWRPAKRDAPPDEPTSGGRR